jgi:hypothetical protein
MICRLCGQHFCYVCGGEWSKHGRSWYNCQFAPHATADAGNELESEWLQNCTDQYFRMLRDTTHLPDVGQRVDELSAYLELGLESGFASKCANSIVDARRVLANCYVAKFYLRGRWSHSLESWTGALESLTETLEVAILSNASQVLSRSSLAQPCPEHVWRNSNANDVVWDVEAVAGNAALVRDLHNAVVAQAERMKFHGSRIFGEHVTLEERNATPLPNPYIAHGNQRQGNGGCSIL